MTYPTEAVLVTGSGSGIGKACTQLLIDKGYFVFGCVINQTEKDHMLSVFQQNYYPVIMDITQEDAVQTGFELVKSQLAHMHFRAVINIAGVIYNGPLMDVTQQQFNHILAVNTVGAHLVVKAFLPLLTTTDPQHNKVINISSQSGLRTLPFTGIYSASKFALEALSNAMRQEYAVFGIDVSLIEPGQIQTPMADKILQDIQIKPSHQIYDRPMQIFFDRTKKSFAQGIAMSRVIDTIFTALTSTHPKFRYEIHSDYFRDAILFRKLPIKLQNFLIQKSLDLKPIKSED